MELFVNGKSCGKKNVENCLAVFDVVLPFGSSTLEAKGFGEKLTGDAGRKDGNTEDVMNIWYNPLPDQAYKAGSWGYIGGENKSTTSEIQNTIDGPIYQIWRKGDLEYKIDAPKGEYQVELLMADVTKPATQLPNLLARSNGEASSKDARFDVSINGEIKETDFTPTDGHHYCTAFKPKSMPTLRLFFSKSSTSTCALDRIRRLRAQFFICIFVNCLIISNICILSVFCKC